MVQADTDNLCHPNNEEEIIELIKKAITEKLQVRVRGADQSVSGSIYTDDYNYAGRDYREKRGGINIMLDRMRKVDFDLKDRYLVTVQAGCNLGFDPYDPTCTSREDNGLFYILKKKGLAIPNVSDAIHQTVGGFISTSSSGGSITHSFLDAIVSIRLIDGEGNVRVFHRPDPDDENDLFYAVGVSMGLLGIIVAVTFKCVPSFHVMGEQAVTRDTERRDVDLFKSEQGFPDLAGFLLKTEFCRLIWWPFPTAKRLVTWQAHTMLPDEYNEETGTPENFKPKPFRDAFCPPFLRKDPSPLTKKVLGVFIELIIGGIFSVIGKWPNNIKTFTSEIKILGKKKDMSFVRKIGETLFPIAFPHLLDIFMPLDKKNTPQRFWDNWVDGLANDTNEYRNNLLPAFRTEFWVDVSNAGKMMNIINSYYANQFFSNANMENNNNAHSCYVVEILGAKSNSFWMSPAYQRNCIRLNFYSLKQTDGNVVIFFQQFWDLFFIHQIEFRLHWGYYLPKPSSPEGTSYLKSQYPKWDDFMNERRKMDPHNIFLNKYWKEQLGIAVP